MKKNKKAEKDAKKLRKKVEKRQKKLQKKEEKQLKKLHKKEEKEKKKIRKQVEKAFGGRKTVETIGFRNLNHDENNRNKLIENLTRSVVLNKKLMVAENESLKKWREEYYNEMFIEFKEMITKHNEAMNFKLQELTDKIDNKRQELERVTEQLKQHKEELATPPEK